MDLLNIQELFDLQERQEITYPEARKDILPDVIRFVRPAPGSSFIAYSQLDENCADQAIEDQIAYFKQHGLRLTWKLFQHDRPADLRQRLLAHHFKPDEDNIGDVMVLDLSQPPEALLQPVTADVRQITTQRGIKDVISIMERVWGGSFKWMEQRMGGHLEVPGYLSLYVAYHKRKPVSAAWTYYAPNSSFASLWGGSTLPEARHQGFYTALLATRLQEAIRRGRQYIYVEAGPESRPIVARHGFQFLTSAEDLEWQGAR